VTRFLIRRILQGVLVMWLVTVTVFIVFFIGPGPGQVARALAGKSATPQVVEEVRRRLLLNRPLDVQYGHYLWLLLHGNLGYSFYHDQSVNSIIAAAFPITFWSSGPRSCGSSWACSAACCRR
jgi:peptide/nickel transport system permease protein